MADTRPHIPGFTPEDGVSKNASVHIGGSSSKLDPQLDLRSAVAQLQAAPLVNIELGLSLEVAHG